ncbi:MAG: phage major capsid protein [Clostridiales bacterium]|nr:phage major capsid protein [Clostridiales bacterium]
MAVNKNDYDFGGWATRNDIRCSDGRTIRRDAFKDCTNRHVPLVYNHNHESLNQVVGKAYLENRPEGVYAYGSFNESAEGQDAKIRVQHGDITSLSIYANHLKQNGADVIHGNIREVSLVLAGANPGAYIDTIVEHCDKDEEEVVIYPPFECEGLENLAHTDREETTEESKEEIQHAEGSESKQEEEKPMAEEAKKEKTVADVLATLNEEQKTVFMALLAASAEGAEEGEAKHSDNNEGEDEMKHNAFDNDGVVTNEQDNYLSHAECEAIFKDAERYGSLKESVLAHGITDIEYLFPDAKTIDKTPSWIKRPDGWVSKVMSGVKKVPFSRIKSMHADITKDEARAKGYQKGHEKIEEVFLLLKRTTVPQTIYKKQKLDRDDIIDITDFDVVAWMKTEMRWMLDEEIARAILIGDGREPLAEDKINPENIRPIALDDELYTIHAVYNVANSASASDKAVAAIEAAIRARKNYRGSGNPSFYTTDDFITEALLIKDTTGRYIYENEDQLARKLRVKEIVPVEVMSGFSRVDSKTHDTLYLQGLIVNLNDYAVGADKGGAVNMFDDFNIDYNKYLYLIETRCSGALNVPKSAIAVEANFQ